MVLSVINLKGGVGKTTIATNLAVAFALDGYKVVLLDTDKGQNSAELWGANRNCLPPVSVKSVTVESNLSKVVESEMNNFDVVIIDGTPTLSTLAQKTILVSDLVIIPVQPSVYDLRAYEKFLITFSDCKEAKATLGKEVHAVALMNRANNTTLLSKEVSDALSLHTVALLTTKITNRVSYADTATTGQSVLESKDMKAKPEIQALYAEIKEKLKQITL